MSPHPQPWTWEEHELSEGYSCIVYDARGQLVKLDHLDSDTAAAVASAIQTRAALRALIAAHYGAAHALDGPVWKALKVAEQALDSATPASDGPAR
jgi:hypothetical protein